MRPAVVSRSPPSYHSRMDIDWIFFDWGGTLAQVVGQEARLREGARRAALELTGQDGPAVDDFIRRVLSADADAAAHPELREADLSEHLRAWSESQGLSSSDQAIDGALRHLCNAWIGSLETLPGAREALTELRRRGYRMGLVSNCMMPPAACRRELDRLGLAPYLDFTVISSQVGYRKPSERIYQEAMALARNGADALERSRVLFVGDSPGFDVIAPGALGMKTALVTCRRGIWPAADYQRARPDLRIDSVSELPSLLE